MPWTTDTPPAPAKGKSMPKVRACVSAANEALAQGKNEDAARRACIGAMNNADLSRKTEVETVPVAKSEDELQIVWGEVYAPGYPDSDGDYMTADEIRKMAHAFIQSGRVNMIDVQHDNREDDYNAYVVESFIARKNDPDFIQGSWVLGVKIEDPTLWAQVKKGELNGFSFEAQAYKRDSEIEIEVSPTVIGRTDTTDGHSHRFFAQFDDDGQFTSGVTDPGPDGHIHRIDRPTVTEEAAGHTHRFSYVEQLVNGEA